jgi:hypothetical protein
MNWLSISLAAITLTATSLPAFSQSIKAVSQPAQKNQAVTAATREVHYITDVAGKRVRLVGPRFYTDPANAMQFPGRENPTLEGNDLADAAVQ